MDEDRKKRAPKRAPSLARTPELQENQMISLAMQLAKKKLEDGSASSQVICHFLQLGTEKARLERAKLESEAKLAEAKAEVMRATQTSEQLMSDALAAFSRYRGTDFVPDDQADDYVLYDD